jgi:type I restriction enzyme M protein
MSTSPPNNNHADLLRELFQAAVQLRGSIEPSDYKKYVLPLVFLRFLSLRFDQRREQLHLLLTDKSSDRFTADPGEVKEALEDPDEYLVANVFMVPGKARWDYLRARAQADDIKVIVDDALQAVEDAYPRELKGLLPRVFAGSNLSRENVTGLINLFSKDIFRADHGGADLIGKVYEYFIGEFADSEGKRGGEYFTPVSIVQTLVRMLEPQPNQKVFDPCCGSGGMFVQSDAFRGHDHGLSFFGQESKEFTLRLCRMNLFIHGLSGDIRDGNSYTNDRHPDLKADIVLANPPFNDGSKGENGWGADRIPDKDPRLYLDGERMPLAVRNANTMWMLHFLHHLAPGGTAGFVMATGELSNRENARLAVRKALVDGGYVDCIVQLTGQLFANTQIPCSLWFLSKNRDGSAGFRERKDEILFIDGRNLGTLIPGSRKQKELSDEEIERIARVYREFKRTGRPEAVPGFAAVASVEEVRAHEYALTPGRYVGAEEVEEEGGAFGERFLELAARFTEQSDRSASLAARIRDSLEGLSGG